MIQWQPHILVAVASVVIALTCVHSQKIIGLFNPVQPPEEVRSTIGNDPPVYLAAPITVEDPGSCGSMDYSKYKKMKFEGYINFAKILTKERQRGNIVLTVDINNTTQIQLCNIEYIPRDDENNCAVKNSTNTTCYCGGSEYMMRKVFFIVDYQESYVRDAHFNLHWVNTHTLSSDDRKLELESYGNFYGVCNLMLKDHLRRLPMIPLHTIADDPPIFIAEPLIMLSPAANYTNANDSRFFDKVFFEAYVNMAKMPYNTRTFESNIILTCQTDDDYDEDLCHIRYDGKYKNHTWYMGSTTSFIDLFCGVESYEDMKLRVFYEMNYNDELLDCYFSVHMITYFTISTRFKTLGTAMYVSKFKP